MSDPAIEWNRLDPQGCADLAHRIIEFVDRQPASESEKLAALLGAAYCQKHFMLEQPEMATAVPMLEVFHEETMASLHQGEG